MVTSQVNVPGNGKALMALLAGAIGIGFAPIFVRLSEVGPSATAGYRVLFALPVLWAWLRYERARGRCSVQPATRREFHWIGLAGLLFTGDLAVWHWSLQYTTVANSTLLANFAPVLVTLGGWLMWGEKLTRRFLAGMVMGLFGATLLVGIHSQFHVQNLPGDLLALGAAVFYAGYLLCLKQLRRRYDGLTIMAWTGLVACAGFFLAALPAGETLWPRTMSGWLVLVSLGLVSHLGGQTLIAFAVGHLAASFSSVGLLLQPVVAGILAWIFFQERLDAVQGLGGILVLAGIALATQPRRRAIV